MPGNLIASFNALFVGGGADKERNKERRLLNFDNRNRRGGKELIEEWPCRESVKKISEKPPPYIDVNVSYSIPLRQDGSDHRPRRSSSIRQNHRFDAKKPTIDDQNDESSYCSTADSTHFSSSTSVDFSCYSLNDMPSCGASVRSSVSRNSINTAPGFYHPKEASRRGSSHDTPTRGLRRRSDIITSTASRASSKKSVRFSDEAPSVHRYVPIAPNTHYTAGDDDYFREYTLSLARVVLRLLQTDAVRDKSFDTLTGLPAAHCLRDYLNRPDIPAEEVVGIEDLMVGTGVASARKRLKKVHPRNVLVEQRRQLQLGINEPKLLARSLKKTSAISSNIARCRAAYAAAIED
jgi:hypothetical protein